MKVGELWAALKLNTDEFRTGLARGLDGLRGFVRKAMLIAAGLVGGFAVAFGALAKKSVSFALDYGKAVSRMAAVTGESVEESSKLVAVFGRFGIEGADAVKLVAMLQKNVGNLGRSVKTSTAFQRVWGFALRDSSGHLKSATQLVLDASDVFNNSNIPAARRAALMAKLFGRSWQDMIPVLKLGSKGILEVAETAKKLGLVLSKDNVDAISKYKNASRDLHEAWAGLRLQLGVLLLPLLARFVGFLAGSLIPTIRSTLIPAVQAVSTWFQRWLDRVDPLIATLTRLVNDGLRSLTAALEAHVVPLLKSVGGLFREWFAAAGPVVDKIRELAGGALGRLAGLLGVVLVPGLRFLRLAQNLPGVLSAAARVIRSSGLLDVLKSIWGHLRDLAGVIASKVLGPLGDLGIKFDPGGSLVSGIKAAATWLDKFVAKVAELAQKLPELSPELRTLLVGAAGAGLALGGLQLAGIDVLGALAAVATIVAEVGIAIFELNPIILGIGAVISGFALAWINDWGGIRELVNDFTTNVLPGLESTARTVFGKVGDVIAGIPDAWARLQGILQPIADKLGEVLPKLGDFLASLGTISGGALSGLAADLGLLVTNLATLAVTLTTDLLDTLNGFLDWANQTGVPQAAISALASALDVLVGALNSLLTWINDSPGARSELLNFLFLLAGAQLAAGIGALAGRIGLVAGGLGALALTAAPLIAVAGAITLVTADLGDLADVFGNAVTGNIDGAYESLVKWTDQMVAQFPFLKFIKDLGAAFGGAMKGIADAVKGAGSSVGSAIGGMIRDVRTMANVFIDADNALIRAWNSLNFTFPKIDLPFGNSFGGFTIGTPNIGYLPHLAKGTSFFPGGLAMLGERGPELAFLPRGTTVAPADATAQLLGGRQEFSFGPFYLQGIGNDVGRERARRFGQDVADSAAVAFRDQTLRSVGGRSKP